MGNFLQKNSGAIIIGWLVALTAGVGYYYYMEQKKKPVANTAAGATDPVNA